ncbi:helix-turn-helix domain-containing protein [Neoaquamicrobium microcysteis]|uniref:helix-turn-helix domain-containing protein n=1 Tax=Neoaquamicrobium microcysteis TaxID=2682781 RepID=UPI001F349556|nr:cupin domain-containing protein [Mesorhizobium microcysteis]
MNIPQPQSQNQPAAQPRIGALIRARRRQLHMTLQGLGDAAGLSVGFLSQVERDQATPSLGALAGIARGLGVEIDYFVATPSIGNGVTRAGQRPTFSLPGSSVMYERLHAEFPGRGLSSFIMIVPPGHHSEMVHHEGDELLYVLEGEIAQTVDGETIRLSAGDSLHFRGSSDHSWANESDRAARILWTGTMSILRPRQEGDRRGATDAGDQAAVVTELNHTTSAGRTKP